MSWPPLPINRWFPRDVDGCCDAVGQLAAFEYRPWIVVDIRRDVEHPKLHEPGWTVFRLRPLDATVTDGANRDRHIGFRSAWDGPHRLKTRYGLCSCCGELMPCSSAMRDREVERELQEMRRYETAGVCPACGEVVTHRMEREMFPNVVVPLGPPVTFHAGRRGCRNLLEKYRERSEQPETQLQFGDME